ncbi:MAG: hypothetical protein ACFFD4_16660, partial [Candidatus Odinarchaeota archaeon]
GLILLFFGVIFIWAVFDSRQVYKLTSEGIIVRTIRKRALKRIITISDLERIELKHEIDDSFLTINFHFIPVSQSGERKITISTWEYVSDNNHGLQITLAETILDYCQRYFGKKVEIHPKNPEVHSNEELFVLSEKIRKMYESLQ